MTDYNVNWIKAPHILRIMTVDTQENNTCSCKNRNLHIKSQILGPNYYTQSLVNKVHIPPRSPKVKTKNKYDLVTPLTDTIFPGISVCLLCWTYQMQL